MPVLLGSRPGLAGVPPLVQVVGHLERRVRPSKVLTGRLDLVIAQWRPVTALGARFPRRAKTDHGAAADQRGLFGVAPRLLDRALDRLRVMAVNARNHLPVVGLEPLGGIVGKPATDLTVDRDAVVVVEHDQLAEPQRTGQ